MVVEAEQRPPEKDANEPASELDDAGSLALDDADDFEEDEERTPEEEDNAHRTEVFTELVPLAGVGDLSGRATVAVKPFAEELLPDSAYMLVDKVVELDARPLKDFPDLDALEEVELERQGICLFTSPRTAKRHCARSQRVIKVPDTGVFGRTSSYLLARGITRLVVDGSVIALDHKAEGLIGQSCRCSGSMTTLRLLPLMTPITREMPTRNPLGMDAERKLAHLQTVTFGQVL